MGTTDKESFGNRIRRERESVSLDTIEAAKLLGVDRTTLYAWEKDKKRPNKRNVRTIAQLYKIDVRELVNLL